MAVSKAFKRVISSVSPYERELDDLIDNVCSVPEIIPALKKEYLERINQISEEECNKAVGRYLRYSLKALYDDEQYDKDISRLMLNGTPKDIELTAQERTAVAALLVHICRRLYGDAPISML